jgi:ribonuclease HI
MAQTESLKRRHIQAVCHAHHAAGCKQIAPPPLSQQVPTLAESGVDITRLTIHTDPHNPTKDVLQGLLPTHYAIVADAVRLIDIKGRAVADIPQACARRLFSMAVKAEGDPPELMGPAAQIIMLSTAARRYDAALPSRTPGHQQGDATPPLRNRQTYAALFDALQIEIDMLVLPLDVIADTPYYSPDKADARFGAQHNPFGALWIGTVFADLTDHSPAACAPWLRHALASAARDQPIGAAFLLPTQAVAMAKKIAEGNARHRPMHIHRVLTLKQAVAYSSSRRAPGDKRATLVVMGNEAGVATAYRSWSRCQHDGSGSPGNACLRGMKDCTVHAWTMGQQTPLCNTPQTPADTMMVPLQGTTCPEYWPWTDAADTNTLQPKFDLAHMWAGDASKLQDGEPVAAGVVHCATGAAYQVTMALEPQVRTVQRGENVAIHTAARLALADNRASVVITTDSQTCLYALLKMLHSPYKASANKHLEMNTRALLTLLSFDRAEVTKVRAHSGELGNEQADKIAKSAALSVHISLQPTTVTRIRRELDAELRAMGHPDLLVSATQIEYAECLTAHRLPYTVLAGEHAFDTRKHLMTSLQEAQTDVILAQQPTKHHLRMNATYTRQAYREHTHIEVMTPQSHASMKPTQHNPVRLRTVLSMSYNAHRPALNGKLCPLCRTAKYSTAHLLLACAGTCTLINQRHDNAVLTIKDHIQRLSKYAGCMVLTDAKTYPASTGNPRVHQYFTLGASHAGTAAGIPDILIFPHVTEQWAVTHVSTRPASCHTIRDRQQLPPGTRRVVHVVEVGYCSRQGLSRKFQEKQRQHAPWVRAMRAAGWEVKGVAIPLACTGLVPTPKPGLLCGQAAVLTTLTPSPPQDMAMAITASPTSTACWGIPEPLHQTTAPELVGPAPPQGMEMAARPSPYSTTHWRNLEPQHQRTVAPRLRQPAPPHDMELAVTASPSTTVHRIVQEPAATPAQVHSENDSGHRDCSDRARICTQALRDAPANTPILANARTALAGAVTGLPSGNAGAEPPP